MPKPPPGFELDPKESLPAGFAMDEDSQDSQEKTGVLDDLGRQVGLTGRYAAQGAAGAVGMLSDPIATVMNQFLPKSRQIKNFRDVIKDYLNRAGVPEPVEATEKIIGQATELGFSAMGNIAGAAGAAKTLTGTGSQVARQMAAAPGQQLAGSTAAGAASQAVAETGGGPIAQMGASLAGGVAGAGVAGIKTAPKAAPAGLKEAEKLGINVMSSDIMPPKTVIGKTVQATGERIPITGTGKLREQQYEQRVDAIKDTLKNFGSSDDFELASDRVMADLAKKRGADLTKYAQMKKDVIERLSDTGEKVVVNRTVQTIDDEIERLEDISKEGFAPGIELFQRFRRDIVGKKLQGVEENRKLLGEAFKAADLATVRNEGEKSVSKIYQSLREDMGDFIADVGERRDYTKWKVANKRLAIMSKELQTGVLKSTLKNGDATPELVKRMIFSTKPSDMKLLYKNLDSAGRANARMAILNRAIENSGGFNELSPQKFRTQLKKLSSNTGVFFKGKELQQIRGLERALDVTRRAGESGVLTNTGMQTVPFVGGAVLADLFGGWGGAVVGTGTIGAVARLYESKPVRDILLKLPAVKKNSVEQGELVKRLISVVQAEKAKQ